MGPYGLIWAISLDPKHGIEGYGLLGPQGPKWASRGRILHESPCKRALEGPPGALGPQGPRDPQKGVPKGTPLWDRMLAKKGAFSRGLGPKRAPKGAILGPKNDPFLGPPFGPPLAQIRLEWSRFGPQKGSKKGPQKGPQKGVKMAHLGVISGGYGRKRAILGHFGQKGSEGVPRGL